jgi:pimeloyl-ACP methyl ester carboxylesterase
VFGRTPLNLKSNEIRHLLQNLISPIACVDRSKTTAIHLSRFLICILVSGCAHTVAVSYLAKSQINPDFTKPEMLWNGQSVQVQWASSLQAESAKYLTKCDQILLADSIHEKGLRHEYKVAGKGTPLVIYNQNPEITPEEKHYPHSGIVLGLTAVKEDRPGRPPLLKLYDPFDPTVVRSAAGPDPIAADYTATLAVLFSHSRKVAGSSFEAFIRPDNPRFATGIYLIHPYDPNKIPILFIHGLLSSPLSWQNLTNDLCSDPKVLEHYQPWFFLYPTGQPVLESAAQLREELERTQHLFDPSGTAVASHHVVVVAHSMGGLLAHTLVSDSGDAIWNAFANKPLNTLALPANDKDLVLQYFFFRHQPAIDRIIFLAVPHRGSYLAGGLVGSIGNRLIRHSRGPASLLKEFRTQYPGTLTPYFARVSARGPTSLMSLAPNPISDSLANLPIKVPFHSIIGQLGYDELADSSDGVVDYRSSHLDGAESEKIVPAGHAPLIARPETVAEIKRILEENIGANPRKRSAEGRTQLALGNARE